MPDGSLSDKPVPLNPHFLTVFVTDISLLLPANTVWTAIVFLPVAGVVGLAAFGMILAILVLVVTTQSEQNLGRLDLMLLILACVLLITDAKVQITLHPGYGTDEAAFLQGAASLLLHGHDPYGVSMLSAFAKYRVLPQPLTYTMGGGVLSDFPYPGLAVLIVAGFAWLTDGVQSVVWADIAALTVAMILAFFMLPRQLRALSVLLAAGLPFLFAFAEAGTATVLIIPFLMVTAWRWTEIGSGGRLARFDWIRALALGLALSIEQLSWFLFPFVILGIWLSLAQALTRRRATVVVARFGAIAVATFLVINAPFVMAGAGSWFSGVLGPITGGTIVNGQGIVDTAIYFHIGGGDVAAFTAAATVSYLALLVAFGLWFSRLGRALFILPVIPFFLSARSLSGYWTIPLLLWAVSLLTVSQAHFDRQSTPESRPRGRRLVEALFAALLVGTGGLLALALTTPAPLQMTVTKVYEQGSLSNISRIVLLVQNNSSNTLRPHFTAEAGGQTTPFWRVTNGASTMRPDSRRIVVIRAPKAESVPASTPFSILAVTVNPETVSSSQGAVPSPSLGRSG